MVIFGFTIAALSVMAILVLGIFMAIFSAQLERAKRATNDKSLFEKEYAMSRFIGFLGITAMFVPALAGAIVAQAAPGSTTFLTVIGLTITLFMMSMIHFFWYSGYAYFRRDYYTKLMPYQSISAARA